MTVSVLVFCVSSLSIQELIDHTFGERAIHPAIKCNLSIFSTFRFRNLFVDILNSDGLFMGTEPIDAWRSFVHCIYDH